MHLVFSHLCALIMSSAQIVSQSSQQIIFAMTCSTSSFLSNSKNGFSTEKSQVCISAAQSQFQMGGTSSKKGEATYMMC